MRRALARRAPRGIFLRLTFGYFVPVRPGTRSKCDPQRGFAPFDNTTWYWTTDRHVPPLSTGVERVGPQILLWSSRPTTAQRGAVVGCLDWSPTG